MPPEKEIKEIKDICNQCIGLVGHQAAQPPHPALSDSGVQAIPEGTGYRVLQHVWRCTDCGSRLFQTTAAGAPPSTWILGEPGWSEADEEAAADRAYLDLERMRQIRSRQFLKTGFLVGTTGVMMLWISYKGIGTLLTDWPTYIAVFAIIIAGFTVLIGLDTAQARFLDVDLFRRKRTKHNPADAWPFPTGNVVSNDEDVASYRKRDPFERYFFDLKETLESKANDADKKASILLDKGTTYTRWGIFFFIGSIAAWQIMSHLYGFRSEYIYGIVSCSALFIFIEFLSAWFLKQYRQYVDTSTYLLKVKAIFDRYMLVYLANRGMSGLEEDEQKRAQFMLEQISKEISWPDSYLLKRQDVGFAKDAVKAIGSLAKELRRRDKADKAKEEK